MARERKGEQFNIRISKEAKEHIKNNAQLLGISQAKYIEKLAIEGCKVIEIRNDEFVKYMESQVGIMNKIGANLNQIAAAINSGKTNIHESHIKILELTKPAFDAYYLKLDENTQRIELN
ncbi:plasmid mobilization protein [Ectopseudomonas khazarica]|uniref:plasmid mobilization protein n=1 Tax=Ectopseudomonas khazarica TaxID=2502979 RepID=UPI0037C9AF86